MFMVNDNNGKWYGSFLVSRMAEDHLKEMQKIYSEREFRMSDLNCNMTEEKLEEHTNA